MKDPSFFRKFIKFLDKVTAVDDACYMPIVKQELAISCRLNVLLLKYEQTAKGNLLAFKTARGAGNHYRAAHRKARYKMALQISKDIEEILTRKP